ncbi:26S proteasome non-ATPase regulatory subunit 14-like protein [Leptotrombidium deliense]|uniref:26S proteasome non-ATPase regulatory subunit 14 n=1 Tax=Leptotrombidium deliense TaxID=299467 RepID=A0A443SB70_9ACAR|nr:26S proteasome non-ATPase regulatory subunit 14-like protein [Leptotrombidium deliense]
MAQLRGMPQGDPSIADTGEQVHIASLPLLKMLKHARAGVPMEVMGLMLGEFVDDYTVTVVDVFAMPQSGTGVSVEAIDPVYQTKMLDMLKQTGRPEMVVGWYHSHPGFGCWLSGVDMNTQQSFEALSNRAIAVVIDPIQSVKGKVVIDAFRLISPDKIIMGQEPRQTTSNLGHLTKPSIRSLIHGLNRHYYSISIKFRMNELEQKMLENLHKKSLVDNLKLHDYKDQCVSNSKTVKEMVDLAKAYTKALGDEDRLTKEQLVVKNVGKKDPKRHLEEKVDVLMTNNIGQCLGAMTSNVAAVAETTNRPQVDDGEQVYISSLALLKMLKHARAGVPMEVMGLMLGEFVDEYTVTVVDVFAMPQSGTSVTVEAVDTVFQTKMLDMLKQTGRPEMVVGWYHSHPGFGCWLSGVDVNTQQSFEALTNRAVAVVVDPIQSVKGKVVIDAFRSINPLTRMSGNQPRQTTSNLGHLTKPSLKALMNGLNFFYYSISIKFRMNELEQKMLQCVYKKSWPDNLKIKDYKDQCVSNCKTLQEMVKLAKAYNKAVEDENQLTNEQLVVRYVGKQDPKRHLQEKVDILMTTNIVECLNAMISNVSFH